MGNGAILRGLLAAAMMASSVTLWASTIPMATVPVGNAGNAADTTTGYGAVSYDYNIGTYDVTLTQYTAFLNSVASTDTYGLYDTNLATNLNVAGISRTGSPGSYSYAVIGDGQRPVTYVTWYDAVRFANWLTDGKTETGAYTITGWNSSSGTGTVRLPTTAERAAWAIDGAAYWYLPDENEWYKAAYYDPTIPGSNKYWLYPTKSNSFPSWGVPPGGSNSANYFDSTNGYVLTGSRSTSSTQNYLTDVGAYIDSPGPYGTFDQGGDVFQWNDLDPSVSGSTRGYRGGDFAGDPSLLAASVRFSYVPTSAHPTFDNYDVGFRVASSVAVPEPGSLMLLLACAVAFGIWRCTRHCAPVARRAFRGP